MINTILKDMGLTQREIDIYLSLLKYGPNSAGTIIDKTNSQNSVFHLNIKKLIKRGFVSYYMKGHIKIYSATDPENILNSIKDRELEFEKIIPDLKKKQFYEQNDMSVKVFDGFKGITLLLDTLINNTKKGDEYLFFSIDALDKNQEIHNFYKKFDNKRFHKGLISKGIAQKNTEKYFNKIKGIEMKFVNYPIPTNSAICNNKYAIFSWGENPKGILIEIPEIAKKQKDFFYQLWNTTK
jgi:sugar-specific transcriptional regulator TrmB